MLQAPNHLVLQREKVQRRILDSYRVRRRERYIYEAAAKLWSEGLGFAKALAIVQSAFDATTVSA